MAFIKDDQITFFIQNIHKSIEGLVTYDYQAILVVSKVTAKFFDLIAISQTYQRIKLWA